MIKYSLLLFVYCSSFFAMDNHKEMYKKRFPQIRKSYKKYSNDDLLFLAHLKEEVTELKKRAPNIFKNEVKIFSIGCHDGDVSKSAIEIVQQHGAKQISFRAVDPYNEHVYETTNKLGKFTLKEIFIEQGDLDKYEILENDKKSAHIILVEQVCHHIQDIDKFIKKITQLAAPQSIILLGHTDDSASAINQAFNAIIGGNKYITTNVCPKIKDILKKDGHTFTKKTGKQKIQLPKISSQTWKFLNGIKGNDYQNNYQNSSETDLEIKNVIEFCATQPLEKLATSWLKKKTFLFALSTKFGNTIELAYKIHVIYFDTNKTPPLD